MSERRFQYEAEVRRNPMNYDAWFDYARLEESAGDPDKVRCPEVLMVDTDIICETLYIRGRLNQYGKQAAPAPSCLCCTAMSQCKDACVGKHALLGHCSSGLWPVRHSLIKCTGRAYRVAGA